MDDIEKKLSAARTRLVLDKPFLGALTLRLPMVEADPAWCPTTATDARSFYYSADYIERLSVAQVQFVLAHEALHCGLSHFARRQHRIKQRWDVACDYAVNPLLLADGLTPPPGALDDEHFHGMTAEEIYPCIDENTQDSPLDKHLYDEQQSDGGGGDPEQREDDQDDGKPDDARGQQGQPPREQSDGGERGGSSTQGEQQNERRREPNQGREGQQARPDQRRGGAAQPPPLSSQERDQLAVQWQQRLAGAAQQALQAGKLAGAMARMVDHLLQPQLPWRMLLARYMSAVARDDYSYMRPSRREGAAILPSLRSSQTDILVAIDTSGSISSAELDEFAAEVNAIKGQVRARLTLVACDAALAEHAPWVYEPWEEFRLPPDLVGGGATNFCPVFEWADRRGMPPDLLVYFTDANGVFPKFEPAFPTLWLVKGKSPVPWGQRIQLN